MVCRLLLFICLIAPSTKTLARAQFCHNNHSVARESHAAYISSLGSQTRQQSIEFLYGLCKADDRCRRAYYMDLDDGSDEKSKHKAFEYLVRHWTASGGKSLSSIAEAFCETTDPETLRNNLWVAKMRLEAYESLTVRCGANERFVFVPSRMQGQCICADEHNCQENGHLASEPITLSSV